MTKMFGTNGIRAIINEELTVNMVLNLGRAIGTVLGPGQIGVELITKAIKKTQ
jgi:phosphomannomutase/phosphoglucomutase